MPYIGTSFIVPDAIGTIKLVQTGARIWRQISDASFFSMCMRLYDASKPLSK